MTIILGIVVIAAVICFLKTGNPFKAAGAGIGVIVKPIGCTIIGFIVGIVAPQITVVAGAGLGFVVGIIWAIAKVKGS